MTDSYLLRLAGDERDWLLNVLQRRSNDSDSPGGALYRRLLRAEGHNARLGEALPAATTLPEATAARHAATRDDILATAGRIISGDRAATYGDARESFNRIGLLWGDIIGVPITATDVARMMIAMKLSRLHLHPEHADSWVDIAGYAALGAEIAGVEL